MARTKEITIDWHESGGIRAKAHYALIPWGPRRNQISIYWEISRYGKVFEARGWWGNRKHDPSFRFLARDVDEAKEAVATQMRLLR